MPNADPPMKQLSGLDASFLYLETAFLELLALPAGKRPASVTRATAGSSRVGVRAARRASR